MSNKGTSYIVRLSDDQYLTSFSQNMWPESHDEITHAKHFEKSITAKYAAEVCREKLNDDYDPVVMQVSISIDKQVI